MRKVLLIWCVLALAAVLLFTMACTSTTDEKPAEATDEKLAETTAEEPAKEETVIHFVGSVSVEPQEAPVGSSLTISGTGFSSGESYDLVWQTVEGSYDIRGDYLEEYHGRVFEEVTYIIATVSTDTSGSFDETITVPEDYGFIHNITVEQNGEVLNRAGFSIVPTVTISPTSGPLGTPITVTMNGIGWARMENSWTLMYDNKYTGLLSAVTTKGTAKAVIPATGGTGGHILKILHGAYQYPYLNTEQNPRPDQPVITKQFTITEGTAVLPPAAEDQGFSVVSGTTPADTGKPVLWTDPATGSIETPTTLHGKGFTPGQELDFLWYRVVGNRVSGSGWDETSLELGTATVQADGSISLAFVTPDDLGGDHRIEAISGGDKITETAFVIKPSISALDVSSGPVGTEITINIKGVGWTETANIYHLVYDNGYLGYACGFNSQGDITLYLPLTGQPGWHYIDLYPGIYKGKEAGGVQNFRIPQLTYQDDHPGEEIPAFRFAVLVTE